MEGEDLFLSIYEENADSIFRLCYFKTSNREIALDLTQETFTKAWNYLVQGKKVDNLRAFIFTIARNLIKDYYKKKKSLSFSDLEDYEIEESTSVSETATDSTEVSLLLIKLNELKDSDRELLQLRFVDQLSVEEISEILGERPNTVSVRIHRATRRFRKRFEVNKNQDE